jgi:hypothetical protein
VIIRREVLKAVLPATTADDTRYMLNGVQIRPDGAVVATDGHVLLIARDSHPQPDEEFPSGGTLPAFTGNPAAPIVVARDLINKLIAAMPKKSSIPILGSVQVSANGDGGAVVSAKDLQVPCTVHVPKETDGRQFPPYDRVLPADDRPELRVCLAVNVLEALIKAAKAVQGGEKLSTGGTITFALPTEPQHQGKRPAKHEYEESPDYAGGKDCPCKHCGKISREHTEPDGAVLGTIGITINTKNGITVHGVAMPCRL